MAYITDNVIGINNENDHIECYCIGGIPEIDVYKEGSSGTYISYDGITTPTVTQTSKEEYKKNFEKLQKALNIIKNIEIYKYNLKDENDNDKKHIGFIIGNNYKYAKEVTSKKNDGVDTYSFISVCCKAIQEQQEIIENLQKQINELKGDK